MTQTQAQTPHARATWVDPTSGNERDGRELLAKMSHKKVVLLGESHTTAEIHRWQLHVATQLHFLRPNIALGFEMFPRRLQAVLDQWVNGEFSTEEFLVKCEWQTVWGYDAALYLPLFHFCRQQGVKMLALNCYRPLVTRVGKEGWDAIPEEERDGLTPSAEATQAYRAYLFGLGLNRSPNGAIAAMDPALDRFVRAQQTWDRAFACNIANWLADHPASLVVGIIGRGHLEYGHGTPYQLRDLGIESVGVLLPSEVDHIDLIKSSGIADAVFRLDKPEPDAPLPPRMQKVVDGRRKQVNAVA